MDGAVSAEADSAALGAHGAVRLRPDGRMFHGEKRGDVPMITYT